MTLRRWLALCGVVEVLRGDGTAGGVLPIAAFGGVLVLAASLLGSAIVHFALVQAADHRFAAPAQTLNVLDNNDFFGIPPNRT